MTHHALATLIVLLVLIVLGLFALVLSTAITETNWSGLSIASVVVASVGVLLAVALGIVFFTDPVLRKAGELIERARENTKRLGEQLSEGYSEIERRRRAAAAAGLARPQTYETYASLPV